jgi:hypothetical protein
VRSAALDLVEHLAEIEAWRLTLSEKRRRQLKHPLSNVAAWRKAPQQAADPLIRDDPVEAAKAAWQRGSVSAPLRGHRRRMRRGHSGKSHRRGRLRFSGARLHNQN